MRRAAGAAAAAAAATSTSSRLQQVKRQELNAAVGEQQRVPAAHAWGWGRTASQNTGTLAVCCLDFKKYERGKCE